MPLSNEYGTVQLLRFIIRTGLGVSGELLGLGLGDELESGKITRFEG
jgi:hypothetical protein